jgi:hypothetical protein
MMFVRATLATRFPAWKSQPAKEVQGMSTVKSDIGRYAIIPEWLLLSGASPRAIQLFAILACRYADREGVAWPSRKRLAEDMRASPDTIDRTIKELCAIGALVVTRRKSEEGDFDSNVYFLKFACTVAAETRLGSRTNADDGSRMDAATGSRTDAAITRSSMNQSNFHEEREVVTRSEVLVSGSSRARAKMRSLAPPPPHDGAETQPPADSIDKPKRPTQHTVTVRELVAEGVSREDAEGWLLVRNKKRVPLTRGAWERMKREAEKAGITAAQAVRICVENCWAGFRASWDSVSGPNSEVKFESVQYAKKGRIWLL